MRLRFNEAKATEAAARLLKLRAGGRMSYMKLIKLLYLVDREALLRWGRAVTTDRHVSMDQGPVVSRIYELIRGEPQPGEKGSIWRQFISEPRGTFEVDLLGTPEAAELSIAEEKLIDEIFALHGHKTRWQLRDLCHALPEWRDPQGSALPIEYRDILAACQKTEAEIATVEQEIDSLALAEALLKPA